jgi:hypothetical protein
MAKLKADPINKIDIQSYLAGNDDFVFEMRCLRGLQNRPVSVSHAGTYSDPVTNKNRQFDFRVKIAIQDYAISLAVECKNLKPNFPLMISRVPRTINEAFHELLLPLHGETICRILLALFVHAKQCA